MAGHFGEQCVETPVGFKWVAAALSQHDALLGGESGGGLTIRGHILGKDGIFASALIVEMLAKTGKHISELLELVWAITGRLYSVEDNLPGNAAKRIVVPRRVQALIAGGVTPYPVVKVNDEDGTNASAKSTEDSAAIPPA